MTAQRDDDPRTAGRRRARRRAAATLALSLAALAAVPTAWALTRPAVDTGAVPSTIEAPAPPRPHASPRLQARAEPADEAVHGRDVAPIDAYRIDDARPRAEEPATTAPAIATRSARLADQSATAVVAPTRLQIPDLGVDAPVGEVGVQPDGLMEVPEDVRRVGWYRHGPAPGGDAGASVLTAHVDSRTQGAGVFFRLRELEVGAQVVVTLADGRTVPHQVVARRAYAKDALPPDEVFRRDGTPVLALITCGGPFDEATRSYAENVVVYAEPIAP